MKAMKWKVIVCVTGMALWGSIAPWAVADPAYETELFGVGNVDATASVGWQFTPTTNIVVTHLGFYDRLNDGLATSHDMALFVGSSSTPLVSTTVPAGTAGLALGPVNTSPFGVFRYAAITPTLLLSNTTYVVAGHTTSVSSGGDGWSWNPQPVASFHPWVAFGDGSPPLFDSGSWDSPGDTSLSNPVGAHALDFSAPATVNFLFLPEPSSALLVGIGALLWRRPMRRT
jgi:hypothetical protein